MIILLVPHGLEMGSPNGLQNGLPGFQWGLCHDLPRPLFLPLPVFILLVAHGLETGSPHGQHGLPELGDLRGVPEQRVRVGPGLPRHLFS